MNPEDYQTVQIGVSPFWARKYAREAGRNWDKFYKRNEARFFRDRHWTDDAAHDGFPALAADHGAAGAHVLEAGCGVGNCALPLLEANATLHVTAFDFAPSAVALAAQRAAQLPSAQAARFRALEWDFANAPPPPDLRPSQTSARRAGFDFATLVFVLSAVPPERHDAALGAIGALLRPGGTVLFRDYATGDLASRRFRSRNRIDDNYFVRQDGTLAVFFDEAGVSAAMARAGLVTRSVRRVQRVVRNRKDGLEMQRVFLQGEFERVVDDEQASCPTPVAVPVATGVAQADAGAQTGAVASHRACADVAERDTGP